MFQIKNAYAHCDIPCKIYDPAVSLVAALSVVRLTDILLEIDDLSSLDSQSKLARVVVQKEDEAQKVKDEVNIIWGDYFKEPQLEAFPETHEIVHGIMRLGSKCKQEVSREAAEELLRELNRFVDVFWKTKDIETKTVIAPYPPALPMVVPILESA
jgi:nickel superoxide dismutase|tara:strand:- start:270 stop:737 length:468 start_codon:yes stop_codon:yes gene_type:complete